MRKTKVISVSLPKQEAKRLDYLARIHRKAKSDIVREAIVSYQGSSKTNYYHKDPDAWRKLEKLGKEISRRSKKGAIMKALLEGRE